MWFEGLLGTSIFEALIISLVLAQVTIVSVTVYLHRYSAHRSLELNACLKHFFRFWLWLTTGMSTKGWTAIHRKHHALCETEQDPHSPVTRGLAKVFWQGAELYQDAETEETLNKFGKGTPDDWLEQKLYLHSGLGIGLMFFLDLLLFGAIGITVWAIQMIWIPFFAAGVINGVGHAWGYRNFECPDASRNILPLAIFIGGEELHNNHHTYPNSPKLSVKWWEFDIGWFWICLFRALGLARVKRTRPLAECEPGKQLLDLETAWAALNDRFQIMSRYSKQVVAPLVKNEKRKADKTARALLARARKLICRDESLITERDKFEIGKLLDAHPQLECIYEMRQSLQAIWVKGATNANEMLEALHEWCKQAEESGIETLREFAGYIRSYRMPQSI